MDRIGDVLRPTVGKIVAGLFGGTLGLCIAYILELSIPDMALAKKRVSTAMACQTGPWPWLKSGRASRSIHAFFFDGTQMYFRIVPYAGYPQRK